MSTTARTTGSATGARVRVRLPLARFDLDFELETDARSIGIFGPSGAGKTSVLEAIAGWRKVREGSVELASRTLCDTARGIDVAIAERGIGYVPQDALLFPHWDVETNIRCGERRDAGRTPSASERSTALHEFERAVTVLELGLLLARRTTSLSGGERQRVALARALCSRPEYLLLDEPLGALDVPLRRRILPYLIRVRETFDVPMLFVSHDATEVQALCDEVAVMREGRVVARGRPSHVLSRALHRPRGFENVLRGIVTSASGGTARVAVAPDVEVVVPGAGLSPGQHALFSLGEDEVLVSRAPLDGISARNMLPARVESIAFDGDDASIETVMGADPASAARLCVRLTRASAQELALDTAARIHLVFKTQSCRVLSAPST